MTSQIAIAIGTGTYNVTKTGMDRIAYKFSKVNGSQVLTGVRQYTNGKPNGLVIVMDDSGRVYSRINETKLS